jgi:hypothetical protein
MRQEARLSDDRTSRDPGYRKNGRPHPDHHLWRNGRLWWIAFTIHRPDWTAERIRRSLGTDDLFEARRRRDLIFKQYRISGSCELSLRF